MLGSKIRWDTDVSVRALCGKVVLEEVGSARATSVERSNWHAGVSHPDIWGQSTKGSRKRGPEAPRRQ